MSKTPIERWTLRMHRAAEACRKHGRYKTPEYAIWASMIQRCHNPRCASYANYGGRGIFVCGRWRQSFMAFLDDVGERPSPDLSIERIDNDRGYQPGNVRWASRKDQQRNRRAVRMITHGDKTDTVRGWSRATGIPERTILYRLDAGWDTTRILTTPPKPVGFGLRRRG